MSVDLPCHRCGYDLRAQPDDGKCPECAASVAEARRWAAVPLRPAWRDSDPRWRRRVLAGVWLLALLPLMDALKVVGWAASVPVPSVLDSRGTVRTLDDTLLSYSGVYQPLIFCTGVVLLFARERGRRRAPLDWTRRWGVLCSYVALLLGATQVLFIASLVMVGIGALLQSMPLSNQPRMTQWFVDASSAYLRYGPQPQDGAAVALTAFSSIAVLLACVPLFDALRSSGPRRLALVLLAPLALFALVHIAQAGRYAVGSSAVNPATQFQYAVYFCPELPLSRIAALPFRPGVSGSAGAAFVEAVKWCSVLAIAVWLTAARFAAWRGGRNPKAA